MKRLLFTMTVLCLLNPAGALAQEDVEAKTLLSPNTDFDLSNIGYFISPSLGTTSFDGSLAALFNIRTGFTVQDKLSLGGYFGTSMNEIYPESETLQDIYMDYWTVGAFMEYTVWSKKLLHLTVPIYMGYGEIEMDNEQGEIGLGESNFFQLEPTAMLELNLHKNIRINAGAGYRFVSDTSYRNLNEFDLSGFSGYIGLKFGLFR